VKLLLRHRFDSRISMGSQHVTYGSLTKHGIRVFEYQPSMMHAKTMLVDDRLVVVGSINLDYLSMELLEEGCLVVDDRRFAAELEQTWELDLSRSRQVVGAPEASRRPEVAVVAATEGHASL